jgi:hypothetical protein
MQEPSESGVSQVLAGVPTAARHSHVGKIPAGKTAHVWIGVLAVGGTLQNGVVAVSVHEPAIPPELEVAELKVVELAVVVVVGAPPAPVHVVAGSTTTACPCGDESSSPFHARDPRARDRQ